MGLLLVALVVGAMFLASEKDAKQSGAPHLGTSSEAVEFHSTAETPEGRAFSPDASAEMLLRLNGYRVVEYPQPEAQSAGYFQIQPMPPGETAPFAVNATATIMLLAQQGLKVTAPEYIVLPSGGPYTLRWLQQGQPVDADFAIIQIAAV